jgi:hypothetical protein
MAAVTEAAPMASGEFAVGLRAGPGVMVDVTVPFGGPGGSDPGGRSRPGTLRPSP